MEIYQLRAFILVARTGHLTRAAEQLHLTQSAVSKQLKALEEELGALLFERSASGMSLTTAGRRLLPLATKAFDAAVELTSTAKAMQGQVGGTFRLGTIIDPESIRLGGLLSALQHYYPEIDVHLQHGISGTALQRLTSGQLDACFFLGSTVDPNLKVVRLSVENYVVAGPIGWTDRLAGASWKDLADMPWIGTPKESSQTAIMDKVMSESGAVRRIAVVADQESSMIDLMRSGVGLCLVRERLARDLIAKGELAQWAGETIPCPLSFVMRVADSSGPLHAAVQECLSIVW